MNELEAQAAEIRQQLVECRDPREHSRLVKSLHGTMQAIHDNQPAPSHAEEIESLRSGGQVGAADLLERQTRISAAQARLDAAQDGPAQALEAAEKALQAALAPTAGQSAPFEKRKLYDEASELSTSAALLKRSSSSEERARGVQMAEDAEEKMQQFYEIRVEV